MSGAHSIIVDDAEVPERGRRPPKGCRAWTRGAVLGDAPAAPAAPARAPRRATTRQRSARVRRLLENATPDGDEHRRWSPSLARAAPRELAVAVGRRAEVGRRPTPRARRRVARRFPTLALLALAACRARRERLRAPPRARRARAAPSPSELAPSSSPDEPAPNEPREPRPESRESREPRPSARSISSRAAARRLRAARAAASAAGRPASRRRAARAGGGVRRARPCGPRTRPRPVRSSPSYSAARPPRRCAPAPPPASASSMITIRARRRRSRGRGRDRAASRAREGERGERGETISAASARCREGVSGAAERCAQLSTTPGARLGVEPREDLAHAHALLRRRAPAAGGPAARGRRRGARVLRVARSRARRRRRAATRPARPRAARRAAADGEPPRRPPAASASAKRGVQPASRGRRAELARGGLARVGVQAPRGRERRRRRRLRDERVQARDERRACPRPGVPWRAQRAPRVEHAVDVEEDHARAAAAARAAARARARTAAPLARPHETGSRAPRARPRGAARARARRPRRPARPPPAAAPCRSRRAGARARTARRSSRAARGRTAARCSRRVRERDPEVRHPARGLRGFRFSIGRGGALSQRGRSVHRHRRRNAGAREHGDAGRKIRKGLRSA